MRLCLRCVAPGTEERDLEPDAWEGQAAIDGAQGEAQAAAHGAQRGGEVLPRLGTPRTTGPGALGEPQGAGVGPGEDAVIPKGHGDPGRHLVDLVRDYLVREGYAADLVLLLGCFTGPGEPADPLCTE